MSRSYEIDVVASSLLQSYHEASQFLPGKLSPLGMLAYGGVLAVKTVQGTAGKKDSPGPRIPGKAGLFSSVRKGGGHPAATSYAAIPRFFHQAPGSAFPGAEPASPKHFHGPVCAQNELVASVSQSHIRRNVPRIHSFGTSFVYRNFSVVMPRSGEVLKTPPDRGITTSPLHEILNGFL